MSVDDEWVQQEYDFEYEERVRRAVESTEWDWIDEEPDPYIYILGLDPGGTTGVAMLRIDSRDDEIKPELVYLYQVKDGLYGFTDYFYNTHVTENVVIVSEKWKERNIKGADRTPQYIEGAQHAMWDHENIQYQYPDQKERVPDEWLKKNNLWVENYRHAMDALKHAFAYLLSEQHSATVNSVGGRDEEAMAAPGEAEDAKLSDEQAQEGAQAAQEDAVAEGKGRVAVEESESSDGQAEGSTEQVKLEELTYQEDEKHGGMSSEGGQGIDTEWDSTKEGFTGERTKRSIGGAFAGYNPDGADSAETLFED